MPYRFLPFPFPVTLRDIESRCSRVATLFKMQQFVEHCAAAHCKFLIDTARRAIPLRQPSCLFFWTLYLHYWNDEFFLDGFANCPESVFSTADSWYTL